MTPAEIVPGIRAILSHGLPARRELWPRERVELLEHCGAGPMLLDEYEDGWRIWVRRYFVGQHGLPRRETYRTASCVILWRDVERCGYSKGALVDFVLGRVQALVRLVRQHEVTFRIGTRPHAKRLHCGQPRLDRGATGTHGVFTTS